MLKLENISFSYDTDLVLKDFSLFVEESEIIAIQGKSGSGKSTILRLIAGLEKMQEGSITLDGNNINLLPAHKRNIGMVFQNMALFPHLTVYKNLEYGLYDVARKERNAQIEEIAKVVGISELLDRYPHEISGGQKQRVAIARSLLTKPKVLLLDEPFTALDAELKEQVRIDIRKILEHFKITTILVTHDKSDADALGAKTILI